MKYKIIFIESAKQDIKDIYNYILRNESRIRAELFLSTIKKTSYSLIDFPNRDHVNPDLALINITEYREIHSNSYKIIYQVVDNSVFIISIVDGRRKYEISLINRILRLQIN